MPRPDLATAPLRDLVDFDFRAPGRDTLADVRTVQGRVEAVLDGFRDADWERQQSASDVPGAPPWTLMDHVGHVAVWVDEAIRFVQPQLDGAGGWPRDEDYSGGDFDAENEGARVRWAAMSPAEVRSWHRTSVDRLLELAERLPADVAASDAAWEWVWHSMTAHPIEHLAPVEGG
jgi:hypothetical protein